MTFKISGIDYSKKLISPYNVNKRKEYDEFIDENGNKHKTQTRKYISGTVKLKLTESEYENFVDTIKNGTSDGLCTVMLTVNNTNSVESSSFYLDFYSSLLKDTVNGKLYDIVELEIEEF